MSWQRSLLWIPKSFLASLVVSEVRSVKELEDGAVGNDKLVKDWNGTLVAVSQRFNQSNCSSKEVLLVPNNF